MFELFALLGLTLKTASASPHCLALRTHCPTITHWAMVGELEGLAVCRPPVFNYFCDLRDYIACPLQKDTSPRDIFANNSSSLCRAALKTTTPPMPTGTRRATGVTAPVAYLYINILYDCCGPFSREFMCNGPARRAADLPQPFLPVIAVNLVDHPIDLVIRLSRCAAIAS